MAASTVIGFSGNITRPSRTFAFVRHVVQDIAERNGLSAGVYDIADLGSSFPVARRAQDLDNGTRKIFERVLSADILVVGTPTYKGSYTGLFKHFFDLVDPAALRGKPVLITATGGGDRHALIVEHQLRPLFGFFEAFTLPTAVYAVDRDFVEGVPASQSILDRLTQAVSEASVVLTNATRHRIAAE
jgi:FMN reductase